MDVPEHASELPSGLIAAYRATRFRVDGVPPFDLRVDVPSPELAEFLRGGGHRGAVFITACNPFGKRLRDGENARRHEVLLEELGADGWTWRPGAGEATGDWTEEASVLVPGIDRVAACAWGRRHQQNAVVWAGSDAVPRLLLLR